jgi:hypothetical protein
VGNLELLPSLRCEEQKTTVSNKETNPQFWLLGCVYVYKTCLGIMHVAVDDSSQSTSTGIVFPAAKWARLRRVKLEQDVRMDRMRTRSWINLAPHCRTNQGTYTHVCNSIQDTVFRGNIPHALKQASSEVLTFERGMEPASFSREARDTKTYPSSAFSSLCVPNMRVRAQESTTGISLRTSSEHSGVDRSSGDDKSHTPSVSSRPLYHRASSLQHLSNPRALSALSKLAPRPSPLQNVPSTTPRWVPDHIAVPNSRYSPFPGVALSVDDSSSATSTAPRLEEVHALFRLGHLMVVSSQGASTPECVVGSEKALANTSTADPKRPIGIGTGNDSAFSFLRRWSVSRNLFVLVCVILWYDRDSGVSSKGNLDPSDRTVALPVPELDAPAVYLESTCLRFPDPGRKKIFPGDIVPASTQTIRGKDGYTIASAFTEAEAQLTAAFATLFQQWDSHEQSMLAIVLGQETEQQSVVQDISRDPRFMSVVAQQCTEIPETMSFLFSNPRLVLLPKLDTVPTPTQSSDRPLFWKRPLGIPLQLVRSLRRILHEKKSSSTRRH